MTDAQTDRGHLQAMVAAEDLIRDLHHLDATTEEKARVVQRRSDIFAAAKQHLDTTKPECGDAEAAEDLARRFHETYERLAPDFGYSTRIESAVPWEDVPDDNKRLMIAVAHELAATTPSPNEAEAVKINLCEGCEPITPHELHALYSLTGSHPAADEVVASVRKKLSHTLGDLPEGAVSDEYKDYWMADFSAVEWLPREIAPKDGTRIIAWPIAAYVPKIVFWHEDEYWSDGHGGECSADFRWTYSPLCPDGESNICIRPESPATQSIQAEAGDGA